MSEEKGSVRSDDDRDPWTFNLMGCFDDPKLCIFTFLVPCFTVGKNAEALGEDGCQAGVWYGLGCVGIGAILRWRVREKQNLMGNMIADAVLHHVCPCCALIQENKQLYGLKGAHVGEHTPFNDVSMARQ